MNALLFTNCFNYTLALYCSMRCVIVPLNQYDDDDDDDDDAYIYTRNIGCITTTPANLALAVSTQPFGARNDYDRAVTSQRRDCEMTRWRRLAFAGTCRWNVYVVTQRLPEGHPAIDSLTTIVRIRRSIAPSATGRIRHKYYDQQLLNGGIALQHSHQFALCNLHNEHR